MLAQLSRFVLPALLLAAALGVYRVAIDAARPAAWEPKELSPRLIEPRYDWPEVVTDQQLHDVLDRMKPGPEANTNVLVHALRLWGPRAEFGDGTSPSGQEMLNYFLDDNAFQARAGEGTPPLFRLLPDGGVDVRPFEPRDSFRATGSHHADDLLATLAESGVALDTPLVTRGGTTTVRNLLETSLRKFHLSQFEFEWTCIAYARYLFPQDPPANDYGQRYDVATLIDEMIEPPLPFGPCNGLHRLEGLAVLYRADEQLNVLSSDLKRKILFHLKRVSLLLEQSQSREGHWNRYWAAGADATKYKDPNRYDQILVTGHQLEWLALAPPEVLPPRETIIRASQWLARAMIEEDAARLKEKYGPFSHAARALSLWRGKEPFDAWKTSVATP